MSSSIFSSAASALYEAVYAMQHLKELRDMSSVIANPPAPLNPYESMILKDEETVSWKLWLGSFGVYFGSHQALTRTAMFRNRLFVPQFIAIVPALAVIIGGGALFRQRTLEKLANPPPGAEKDSALMSVIRENYPFP
jgi:hypothetical protein